MPEPRATLPVDAQFWRGEVARAREARKIHEPSWQTNVDYYTGTSKDATDATANNNEWVNVNVDFYQVEQKQAQLFYETPELQIAGTGPLKGQAPIIQAHRALLNELLGPDHADALTTVQKSIKRCLASSGAGATKIGYTAVTKDVKPPAQLGAVFGLQQSVSVPIHESWYWSVIPDKKLLKPADFHDTDFDKAPWLGHEFRMPFAVAQRQFQLPPDFTGTSTRDEKVYDDQTQGQDTSDLAYVDGVEIWYRAAMFDPSVLHPELYRVLVLIEGVEEPVKHQDSPFQELDPATGRLTADSMIGNTIHILTLRDVPDSSWVPSDLTMTRPLVRELCRFRTQMVQERDANRPYVIYDIDAFPPEVIAKIENRTIGSLIGVEAGKLQGGGVGAIMAAAVQGTAPRQTYLANDYITRDIEKTLGIDAAGAGVSEDASETATKTAEVARSRNVRLDAERRRVLQWYLKGVQKFSALVCRYMTPQLAVSYIGEQPAQAWAQWDKKAIDGRLAFAAKPDSQIKLDAAQERKFALDLYQFLAKDPNVVRVELLKDLVQKAGLDPAKVVVDQLPEEKPDPNIGFTFKGEDLIGPQAPIVLEILAQGGIQVSQPARDEAAGQLFKQMALGVRDASGKAVPATPRPQGHGGPADQVRPLSKQTADRTGNRPGRPPQEAA